MDQKQQNILAIGIILALLAIAIWQFLPLDKKIRKGLDLQGGLSLIMTAKETTTTALTADVMNRAEFIVRNRVDKLGVSEATVQRQGADSILIQLPGIKNAQEALKVLGSTGQLEFVDVQSLTTSGTIEQGSVLKAGTYKPFLTGDHVQNPVVSVDNNLPAVSLTFDDYGAKIWGDETTKLVGKQIAIVLDGVVKSAPRVNEPILGGNTQISGKFTPDEAKNLALVLQSGALPVTLTYSDSRVVGPTLGQESLRQGLLAAMIGLGLVAVYLAVYYRGLGLLTWLPLGVFTALFLGVLAIMSALGTFALSLPGIAGMVLTIGLAADSSILILERFKEEVKMGKTYRSAAKSGTRHAIGTSVDADLVTFVSAIVLFSVAIGPVRGFALTLMIGIVIDLTVAILFTRSVLIILSESVIQKAPGFFGVKVGDEDA